jgi:hypothetical protein
MTERLQKSKDFTEEYCCSVVRVGELTPVENSDRLMQTRINGENIVVNKEDVKEGDVMLYVSNECQISGWFLMANNMYRHHALNSNRDEVEARLKQDPDFLKSDDARKMTGYFEDNGRVKMIKLRGCPSFGVLFRPETMTAALRMMRMMTETRTDQPPTEPIDWEPLVGQDFDTIDGYPFVRAYVPKRNEPRQHGQKGVSRWDRFDRMVPGQFKLHYDTAPLKKHLMDFSPKTRFTATVKMHGTSFICGHVLVNTPLRLFRLRRLLNRLLRREIVREFRQEYGMVVSSRKVIKNEWANSQHPEGYYGVDIWTEYANIIFPYLPKGYTLYGEICGYLTGDAKMIQKDYDYGCAVGRNFLMPYRVTRHEDGRLVDLSIEEVGQLTARIKAAMHDDGKTEDCGRLLDIRNVRLFEGTVEQLTGIGGDMRDFPDRLADHCRIEADEPLCSGHRVPREGVVVRIEGDEVPEAFKLKSMRFLEREKKAIDQGDVDMEMQEVAQPTEE